MSLILRAKSRASLPGCCFLFILLLAASSVQASDTFAQRAEKAYQSAKAQFEAQTNNNAYAWEFGRTCFDWAEFSADDDSREKLANEGIAACRQAVANDPKLAPAYYYLAMDLGQLARTKTLGALSIVREMETTFKKARDLDETVDYAGPDRSLGMLYFEAPGWPTSIGSRSKARAALERAVVVDPSYPDNHLSLIEAYLKWGDRTKAEKAVAKLGEVWAAAKAKYTDEKWEQSWADWDKRWAEVQKRVQKKTTK